MTALAAHWAPSSPYADTDRAATEDAVVEAESAAEGGAVHSDAPMPLASIAVVIQHPSVPVKLCTACGKPLPLSAFAADRRASDGRQSMCRTCQVTRRRTQRKPRRIANLLAAGVRGDRRVTMSTPLSGERSAGDAS